MEKIHLEIVRDLVTKKDVVVNWIENNMVYIGTAGEIKYEEKGEDVSLTIIFPLSIKIYNKNPPVPFAKSLLVNRSIRFSSPTEVKYTEDSVVINFRDAKVTITTNPRTQEVFHELIARYHAS